MLPMGWLMRGCSAPSTPTVASTGAEKKIPWQKLEHYCPYDKQTLLLADTKPDTSPKACVINDPFIALKGYVSALKSLRGCLTGF